MKNKKGGSEWHGDGGKQHALTIKYLYIYITVSKSGSAKQMCFCIEPRRVSDSAKCFVALRHISVFQSVQNVSLPCVTSATTCARWTVMKRGLKQSHISSWSFCRKA